MLETERLLLIQPTLHDAQHLLQYALRNREVLAEWQPLRSESYFEIAYWTKHIELIAGDSDRGSSYSFALVERSDPTGVILGQCTLSNIVRGVFHAAYLGYSLDRDHWRRGLMREALERLIRYSFDDLKLHRIMANYMPRNERSGRLLKALGFSVEGYARNYLQIAGVWEDHILTSVTNPIWDDG